MDPIKTAGIIAEYNSFHNGHQYQIEEIRRQTGADYIIAAMSGDFVQRGEPAIFDKYTRARMALLQIAQQENLLPTDEEIDKQLSERAEKTKKTVEEIKAGTDIAALRRNEGIRKAADWVIDHSTIEEKVESK